MRTGKARRIRAAVKAQAITALFNNLPGRQRVRAAQRRKLSVTGMIVFDEIETRRSLETKVNSLLRAHAGGLRRFEQIIADNYPKGTP